MSARPTIEECVGRHEDDAGRISGDVAIHLAKEYAAERTAPLVNALRRLLDVQAAPCDERCTERNCASMYARAALAAEAEARQ